MITLEEKIEELFKQGLRQQLIAKEVSISVKRVKKILNQLNLKRTPDQQGEIIRNRRRASLSMRELEKYYFEDGLSIDKIAIKLGVNHSQLRRRIQELGWTREDAKRIPSHEKVSRFTKEQIEELYINQNKSSHECQDVLDISRNCWKKLIKKFNIVKDSSIIQQNKKINLVRNLQEKYGVDNVMQLKSVQQKREQTILDRNCGQHYAATESWRNKHSATRKKHNTWNSSLLEEKVYNLLLTKFDKTDIDRQHKDINYPFNCDFYVKSLYLYIEIQGSAFHDKKPFNPKDSYCQKRLNQLLTRNNSYSDSIIDTWTNKDVVKRNIAKQNSLNFKEFYTLEEFQDWFKLI